MSEETKNEPKQGGKKIVKVVNEGVGISEKVTNNKPEIKIKTEKRATKPFKIKEIDDEQAKLEASMMKKLEYFNNLVFYKLDNEVHKKKRSHKQRKPEYKNIKCRYR